MDSLHTLHHTGKKALTQSGWDTVTVGFFFFFNYLYKGGYVTDFNENFQ